MTATPDIATESDVALDLLALIDGEPGNFFGSEETTILNIESDGYVGGAKNHLVLTLDNGQKFNIVVEAA